MGSRTAIGLIFSAAFAFGSTAAADDFDPRGRHHHPAPPTQRPTTHAQAPSHPDAAPAAAGPASPALVERYARIVLQQPGAAFPLQRLAQLYRDKDGNLKGLIADFQRRAAEPGPDQYGATVALAGICKLDGRSEDAVATYRQAIALRPTDAAAPLALAHTLEDRGDAVGARPLYVSALGLQKVPAERELTLRTLMTLALDAKDWDAAKDWHGQLVKMQPTSLFERGELARELFSRGEYARAEDEFRALVTASQGDNRALAPALKDLGKTLAKAHKSDEAIATLRKALQVAGAEAGVRHEVYDAITEIYRADQRLPEWVKLLEGEHPGDFPRLALLGSLYEETGDAERALATYRRALAVSPRQIDLRLKMIRLLQSQGELDTAIREYEGLIRAAPNDPQFVFEECEALLQRGDRARALKLLLALEARVGPDEDVLARVADFYQRIGEGERSLKVLTRLTQTGTNDPSHLVDLGDRYFQDGNTALAVQTWKRILVAVQPRAKALSALADVYLEHDMTADALSALREALQLDRDNLTLKKQLAGALERAHTYREATQIWAEVSSKAKQSGDKLLAREARSQLVKLWGLERVLEAQVGPLSSQFGTTPPDIEAGRTLAEVQLHLRRLADAESTLRGVVLLAPGDAESYLALELALAQEHKLDQAIEVLEKLVIAEPKQAREAYQRMAQYARDSNRTQDAIRYGQRAVDLNPDDAEGHLRLAKMYASLPDPDRAITEYRAAIQKNDRLFLAYFELADLLLARGDGSEADRLFRRVVRGAADDELVTRAAHLSMQLNLGNGTLESLEQELLPLAIGNPQRPLYRKILVEVYGSLTFALVQSVRRAESSRVDRPQNGEAHQASTVASNPDDARTALARIGARAVKPLLDALVDPDPSQERIAIDVLGYVASKNAGPALFSFAIGGADTQLRMRAMVACGALRDGALLSRYEAYFAHDEDPPSDSVALAALWGVARMEDKRALSLLRKMAKRGTPEMRAVAVLGLGALKDRASVQDIASVVREGGAGNLARASAAYVLGEFGREEDRATLLSLAENGDSLSRQMAVVALARAPAAPSKAEERATIDALAGAVFAGGDPESPRAVIAAEGVRRAGSAALVARSVHSKVPEWPDPFALVEDSVNVEAILGRLVPSGFSDEDRAGAFVAFEDAIARAARQALAMAGDGPESVVDALSGEEGTFAPFVGATGATPAAHEAARAIARELEPALIPFSKEPNSPSMRARVLVLLARSPTKPATEALVEAVSDANETVQRTALSVIGGRSDAETVSAVGRILGGKESNWAMRVLAAQAMGRLGLAGGGEAAATPLLRAATGDSYALVRESSLKALASFDASTARPLARTMAESDPEPRVREAAARIASSP